MLNDEPLKLFNLSDYSSFNNGDIFLILVDTGYKIVSKKAFGWYCKCENIYYFDEEIKKLRRIE